jgi:hypothetical protein
MIKLQLEALGDLDAFGKSGDSRINGTAFSLQALALVPELRHGDMEDLDVLVILQLRHGVLVLGKAHVNGHVDHAHVGVAKAGV